MKRIAGATGPAFTLLLLGALAALGETGCVFDSSGISVSTPPNPDEFYKCQDQIKKCAQGSLQVQVSVSGPAVHDIAGTVQQDAAFEVNAPLYSNTDNTWIVQNIEYPPLKGAILLKPSRDHWNVSTGEFLNVDFPSFDHIGDALVAYDARVNPKPAWLLDTQTYQPVTDATGNQLHIVTQTPDSTKASPTVRLALYRVVSKVQGHPLGEPMWKIPGNNCLAFSPGAPGGCTGSVTWPKNLPDKNKAMYVVIVTRKEVPDCTKGTVEEQTIYEGCQKGEQHAKDEALKKCHEECLRKSQVGENPAYFQCLAPVCEKVVACPKQSGLVQPRSFGVSSVVEFEPSKYKSEANISVQGQKATKKVEGLIHFHYVLDELDTMKELRVDSMQLKVEPVETEAGRFTDIVLVLRENTRATCQESPPPYAGVRPCTHYAIPAGAFKILLGASKQNGTLLFDPRNKALLDIQIDHAQRTFRIKGGPLSTAVKVDGSELPLDIDIDLFGHFLNFAPHAVGRMESTRSVECSAGRDKARTNRDPILLHSAGSFEVYKDPIQPNEYEWYEDYTWAPEKLWGTGPKLTIPAHKMTLGVHQMTLVVRDPFGIADTDTFPVEVRDTLAPQIIVPQDVHYLVIPPGKPPVKVSLGTAWAQDACSGAVEITNDAPKDGGFPAGTTTVTWTAEDGAGNKESGVQKVHVYTLPGTTDPAQLAPQLKNQASLLLAEIRKTRGGMSGCEESALRAANPRALGESAGRLADAAERMAVTGEKAAARDQLVATLRRSQSQIGRAVPLLDSAQAERREVARRKLCHACSGALAGAAEGIERALPRIDALAAGSP